MKITRRQLRRLIRETLLLEGVNDPGMFKAIFMAGCPGSGKGSVLRTIFGTDSGTTASGLKIVNQDSALDRYLAAADLMGYQQDFTREQQSLAGKLGARARKNIPGWSGITPERFGLDPEEFGKKPGRKLPKKSMLESYISGRLGLVIDGTAASLDNTLSQKDILERLGYDTMMIVVSVPREESVRRNRERGLAGGRGIPDIAVERTCWKLLGGINPDRPGEPPTPSIVPDYEREFGNPNFIEVDNMLPIDQALKPEDLRKVNLFINSPVTSQAARDWILQNQASF